jgi:molybdate/tungstate transport system permease protein
MSSGPDTPQPGRRARATVRPSGRTAPGRATTVFALLGACLALFVVGPVAKLLLFSPWSGLGDVFGDRELHTAVGVTLLTASAATLLIVVFGVPLAYLLARHAFRGRSLLEAALQIPVMIPHPVAGIALLVFLGRETAVGRALAALGLEVISHTPGLVAAMAFVSAPIFVSAAREGFAAVDPTLERVARTLGDGPWAAFRRVTLPLAGRSLAAGAVVTWARAVSEFGAVVVVTYHPKVASVLIFDRLTTDGLAGAVPAAALLVLVGVALVAALSVLNRRRG